MSGFSADWLRLREPFDTQARHAAATALALPRHAAAWRAAHPVLQVVDLASGSGANLRELAPRLGGPQRWRLVDHDPALLAAVPQALAAWAGSQGYRFTAGPALQVAGPGFCADIHCEPLDLASHLHRLDLASAHLVTASALLDLVSAAWLQALTKQVQGSAAALLFALNVDGRTHWDPADPDDGFVHGGFSRHQRRDKGFGPALGPEAVPTAMALWAAAGYRVRSAQSDWAIAGAHGAAMLHAMIDGTATAAMEQEPGAQARVHAWQARRRACVAATRLAVGHVDLMAVR
ncbi:MAG TPA: hypothetical protein VFL86_03595 [Burkholderiaceae bacterium]|nr:hypothetical protein [Burkholderiaceae bacterium]